MNKSLPIRYRGFYDVPRNFLTTHQGTQFLFSCPFDDDRDEYPHAYQVYVMSNLTEQDLEGDWEELPAKAGQYLGEIPVVDVQFDPSRRKEIEPTVLENLLTVAHSRKL